MLDKLKGGIMALRHRYKHLTKRKRYRVIFLLPKIAIPLFIWFWLSIPSIPEHQSLEHANLRSLIKQVEDKRFLYHLGVDVIAVARAGRGQITAGKNEGGSTIEQQLLKHYRNNQDRSIRNKIKEQLGAVKLSILYQKKEILSYYMENVPFPGHQIIGYNQACDHYFGKDCDNLFDSQLLFLIATAQYGSSPYNQNSFNKIKKLSIRLCSKTQLSQEKGCDDLMQLPPTSLNELNKPLSEYDPRTLATISQYGSGAFDLGLSNSIQKILDSNIGLLKQGNANDCCIIVLDKNGNIFSYNQCRKRDDKAGKIDLCRTRRQTGSAIKPFIYQLAFDSFGRNSGTTIEDKAVTFQLKDGGIYEPKNFDNKYHGTVTLAQALGNSFNISAIKITHELGVDHVVDHLNRIRLKYSLLDSGELQSEIQTFDAERLGLSVALGTYETSPLEFARMRLHWLQDDSDNTNQIIKILSNRQNRLISFGIDNYLNRTGRFVKTGTSRKFVDGRTCGGNVELGRIVCVRVGNYDVTSMEGASIDSAGYLWYLVTKAIEKN